jgi:hypothetical protein
VGPLAPLGAFALTWLIAGLIPAIPRGEAVWLAAAMAATSLGPTLHRSSHDARLALAMGLGAALAWGAGLVVVGGIGIAMLIGVALGAPAPRRAREWVAWNVALPALTCAGVLGADWYGLRGSGAFWATLILAVIVSADIRWLCARVAMYFSSRGARRVWGTARTLTDHGASALQVVVTLALLQSGRVSVEVASACILGALVVELSVPLRAWMSESLDREDETEPDA